MKASRSFYVLCVFFGVGTLSFGGWERLKDFDDLGVVFAIGTFLLAGRTASRRFDD